MNQVPQLPSKGATRGMLVGMNPESSDRIGTIERIRRATGRSSSTVSENVRDGAMGMANLGIEAGGLVG